MRVFKYFLNIFIYSFSLLVIPSPLATCCDWSMATTAMVTSVEWTTLRLLTFQTLAWIWQRDRKFLIVRLVSSCFYESWLKRCIDRLQRSGLSKRLQFFLNGFLFRWQQFRMNKDKVFLWLSFSISVVKN